MTSLGFNPIHISGPVKSYHLYQASGQFHSFLSLNSGRTVHILLVCFIKYNPGRLFHLIFSPADALISKLEYKSPEDTTWLYCSFPNSWIFFSWFGSPACLLSSLWDLLANAVIQGFCHWPSSLMQSTDSLWDNFTQLMASMAKLLSLARLCCWAPDL